MTDLMTKMLLALLTIAVAPAFHSTAFGQGTGTAQELYDRCAQNDPICGSYLMGVATVMFVLGTAYKDPQLEREFVAPLGVFALCSTGNPVTGRTLPHIFMAWIDRHPDRKQDAMGSSAMNALSEAWPCEKTN